MATNVLSETLLWRERGRNGEGRAQNSCPGPEPGCPLPPYAPVDTHQGRGAQIGWAQVSRLSLLIILIQLHPILGLEKERGSEVKRAWEQGCEVLRPGLPKSRAVFTLEWGFLKLEQRLWGLFPLLETL